MARTKMTREVRDYKKYLSRTASRKGYLTYTYKGKTYYTYEYAEARKSKKAVKEKFLRRQERRQVREYTWYDDRILTQSEFNVYLKEEKELLKLAGMSTSNAINNVVNLQEAGASHRAALALKLMLKETGQYEKLLKQENLPNTIKGIKELRRRDIELRKAQEAERESGKLTTSKDDDGIIDFKQLKQYYHELLNQDVSSKDAKHQIAQMYFGSK